MSDVEEIRKRLQKRKGTYRSLDDHSFKKVYNGMIRMMVLLLVGLSIVTYTKVFPNTNIKDYILNNENYKVFTNFVSSTFLSFLPNEDIPVNGGVQYTHIKDTYYTNNTNEVINLNKGKVVYAGNEEQSGYYVVVLFENDVQVRYAKMQESFVKLYDTVEQGMVIGTYNEKVSLEFEYLGKEITYETFLGME